MADGRGKDWRRLIKLNAPHTLWVGGAFVKAKEMGALKCPPTASMARQSTCPSSRRVHAGKGMVVETTGYYRRYPASPHSVCSRLAAIVGGGRLRARTRYTARSWRLDPARFGRRCGSCTMTRRSCSTGGGSCTSWLKQNGSSRTAGKDGAH